MQALVVCGWMYYLELAMALDQTVEYRNGEYSHEFRRHEHKICSHSPMHLGPLLRRKTDTMATYLSAQTTVSE
jgi:hypothetical protein